jgi:hypothetical protein
VAPLLALDGLRDLDLGARLEMTYRQDLSRKERARITEAFLKQS